MFRIYISSIRGTSPVPLATSLASLGYDEPQRPPNVASSIIKFQLFDLNYAYNFFFRDVVGIAFFAETSTFYDRFSNLHNTHGLVFEKTFSPASLLPDRFLYHDPGKRIESDPGFTVSDSLFQPNALGFQTADGFLAPAHWKQNISRTLLERRSWSDWYFFKPAALPLNTALASPVGPVP
jgi:hypothetical protein